MKTTSAKSNKSGAQLRPEQLSTSTGNRAQIDFQKRRVNRSLNTESLLALLREETPKFLELVQVVGRWVWIQFSGKQPSTVTRVLAELGFSWHSPSQSWYHPGGTFAVRRVAFDPRKKNGSYRLVA